MKKEKCNNYYVYPVRCSKEFMQVLNEIKARCLINGKNITYTKITQMIANKIKKEDLIKDGFIKF